MAATSTNVIRRSIMQLLQELEGLDHPAKKDLYRKILNIAKEENASITQNRRGFWFNLVQVSETGCAAMWELFKSLEPPLRPAVAVPATPRKEPVDPSVQMLSHESPLTVSH